MFENLAAPRASLNAPIDVGLDIVSRMNAAGKYGLVALFAEQIGGGGGTGSYMIPLTATQKNGSAMWVDTSHDLTTMGVPTTLPVYLQVWSDTLGYYCDVAGVAKDLDHGESLDLALA